MQIRRMIIHPAEFCLIYLFVPSVLFDFWNSMVCFFLSVCIRRIAKDTEETHGSQCTLRHQDTSIKTTRRPLSMSGESLTQASSVSWIR